MIFSTLIKLKIIFFCLILIKMLPVRLPNRLLIFSYLPVV